MIYHLIPAYGVRRDIGVIIITYLEVELEGPDLVPSLGLARMGYALSGKHSPKRKFGRWKHG